MQLVARSHEACLVVCLPRGTPDGPIVARKFDSMDLRLVNSEAVAHTPQPHIGEAYVGINYYISTMYRGAVPITEHQPADVLEPLRGTGWRGYPNPTKALRSGRFACPALRAIVGLGGMRNRSAVHVISIFVGATAAYRLLWIFANCATRR